MAERVMSGRARWAMVLGALCLMGVTMPTVFEVLLHAARNLDGLVDGTATADGSAITLIDARLGASWAGRADDDFAGGSLFLLTNARLTAGYTTVADEALGKVTTSRMLWAKLRHVPVRPGLVTIDNGLGDTWTDDGQGKIEANTSTTETNVVMASGAGPWDLGTGNIEPGTLSVKASGGSPNRLYYDDGAGYLRSVTTGTAWAVIDYDAGTVTRVTGAANLSALSLADFVANGLQGTINYETGEVYLRFPNAWTVTMTADYQYGYAAFLPIIVLVDDFAQAAGTLTFEPGALALGTSKGDAYAVMSKRYPRWLLFQKLNEVLREISDYVAAQTFEVAGTDPDVEADTVTVADTARIVRVMAGDSTTGVYRVITRWRRALGKMLLLDGVPDGCDVVVVETLDTAPQVAVETTQISAWYSADWLGLETAVRCMRWRLQQPGADAALLTTLLNDLMRRASLAKSRLTAWRSVSVKWPEYPEC